MTAVFVILAVLKLLYGIVCFVSVLDVNNFSELGLVNAVIDVFLPIIFLRIMRSCEQNNKRYISYRVLSVLSVILLFIMEIAPKPYTGEILTNHSLHLTNYIDIFRSMVWVFCIYDALKGFKYAKAEFVLLLINCVAIFAVRLADIASYVETMLGVNSTATEISKLLFRHYGLNTLSYNRILDLFFIYKYLKHAEGISIKRIITKIIMIHILVVFIVCGIEVANSWDSIKASQKVKEYVIKTYGLTPTHVTTSSFFNDGATANVYTEEYPFSFFVFIKKEGLEIYDDKLLPELVEYRMTQHIQNNLKSLGDDIYAYTILKYESAKDFPELTFEEVNSDPEVVFKFPEFEYTCTVSLQEPDAERSFLIFKQIKDIMSSNENFRPQSITFCYYGASEVTIESSEFENINSADKFSELMSKK